MHRTEKTLLLFGASGAIGQAIGQCFLAHGWAVTGVSRTERQPMTDGVTWVRAELSDNIDDEEFLDGGAPYQAVCWAQGANLNDSVYTVDVATHLALYKTNCLMILSTMKLLLQRGLLGNPARMCVLSSIWQNIAKQDKLSYGMTKAALQGLVLSAAADLAKEGHLINAILPGAIDTPMTRQTLKKKQIETLSAATRFGRLPHLEDVANLAYFLCSENNTGITAQFIAADLGFSHVRII